MQLDPSEDAENLRQIKLWVLTLWQTALIRLSKITITDEIDAGLRWYDAAFFEVMPTLNAELRDAFAALLPGAGIADEPVLQAGSWIGGDRDGNPNVTGDVVAYATRRAAETALDHYLDELDKLQTSLSLSRRMAPVTDELLALAQHAADAGDARDDEPYRQALSYVHDRLMETHGVVVGADAGDPGAAGAAGPAGAVGAGQGGEADDPYVAYATPEEFLADLDVIDASLRSTSDDLIADDRPYAAARVTLIKAGSATHSFNMEQRFLELPFTRNFSVLKVQAPANANLAPPGRYLLFLGFQVDGQAHNAPLVIDTSGTSSGGGSDGGSTSTGDGQGEHEEGEDHEH